MARQSLVNLLRSRCKNLSPAILSSGYQSCRSVRWVPEESVKPTLKAVMHLNSVQKRWASQAKNREDENKISIVPQRTAERGEEDEKESDIVYYHGPFSDKIKKGMLLSLSACCLSVLPGLLVTFVLPLDLDVILVAGASVLLFTTAAAVSARHHRVVRSYVHKLRWKPGSDSLEVEMLSWLGTRVPRTMKFADIRPPQTDNPFVTFEANGNFYLVDFEHFHNKALLARLLARLTGQGHDSSYKVVIEFGISLSLDVVFIVQVLF